MADTLRLDVNAHTRYADGQLAFISYKGIGLALHGYLKYFSGKNTYSFSVEDAGFMRWGRNSNQTLDLNQEIEFTGVELNVANRYIMSGDWRKGPDSLYDEIMSGWEQKPFTQMMPMRLNAFFSRQISSRTELNSGIAYLLFYHSLPEVYASGRSMISKHFGLMYGINAGGYSGLGIAGGIIARVGQFGLTISSTQLGGWIAPKKITGQSLYLSLSLEQK
jgi:hypothetical protein